MCMVYGVVLDEDVFAWTIFCISFANSTLHTDTVVASVDGVVYDEHFLAATDVEGVAILCVPRTADCCAVDDDVGAASRD
jgi:hypothetical protein